MDCVALFKCLGDETRLRILNLLMQGPLCVCHVQSALLEPQAKASKQLAYMKKLGLLVSRRKYNWTIYEISPEEDPMRDGALKNLASHVFTGNQFFEDRKRLKKMDTSVACEPSGLGIGVAKKLPFEGQIANVSQ